MPKVIPPLSNCYFPQPLPSDPDEKATSALDPSLIFQARTKVDKRQFHEFRQLVLQTSVVGSASGSSHVELGHTKVICEVKGPLTLGHPDLPTSSTQPQMEEGTLAINVHYISQISVPLSSIQRESVTSVDRFTDVTNNMSNIISHETDLAARLQNAVSGSIPLKQYPKCVLFLQLHVLQDDGSILEACIAAISLALADAGVEVYDLVTACTVAIHRDTLYVDPTREETSAADAIISLAMMPQWKEVTMWNQRGKALNASQSNQALQLCRQGCHTMSLFLQEHLRNSITL